MTHRFEELKEQLDRVESKSLGSLEEFM